MIQEPSKSLSQEISYKHLCKDLSQDVVRIFTTSSRKDVHKTLVKIFTDHGPLRQTGTTVFCEPAQSKCTWTYQKGPFQQKKNNGNAADHDRAAHLVRACAVEMHTEISQGTFVREFTMKSQGPQSVPGSNTGL